MAKLIGGLTIKAVCDMCDISRMTLNRYRNDPHWPGDDAPLEYVKAFIISKRPANRSGRKKSAQPDHAGTPHKQAPDKSRSASAAPELSGGDVMDELDDEFANLQNMLSLDDELKRTVIEKNKAQIAQYQQKCLQAYRDKLHRKVARALGIVIAELREQDLTRAQLLNIGSAFARAQAVLDDGDPNAVDDAQPELDLGEKGES